MNAKGDSSPILIILGFLLVLMAGLPASALWDLLVKHVAWRGGRVNAYQVNVFRTRHLYKF